MKTNHLQKMLAVMVVAGLTLSAVKLRAQTAADNTAPQAAAVASVPQLSDGASQILRLTQAKVGADTVIAYIKNSGNSYSLNADQIIFLRQQGVSEAVLGVMLNQPKTSVAAATAAVSVPELSTSVSTITTPSGSSATVAPTVTYVQTVPSTAYYYQPYYYPDYAWYPPVVFSFGWGGGHGGGFNGGGYHGGGFHGGFRR
jgi:hypothetical protein